MRHFMSSKSSIKHFFVLVGWLCWHLRLCCKIRIHCTSSRSVRATTAPCSLVCSWDQQGKSGSWIVQFTSRSVGHGSEYVFALVQNGTTTGWHLSDFETEKLSLGRTNRKNTAGHWSIQRSPVWAGGRGWGTGEVCSRYSVSVNNILFVLRLS